MKIIVNSVETELPDASTIADLLQHLKVKSQQVAVEWNLEVVPRENHQSHTLAEGDQLEVVTLVGGG